MKLLLAGMESRANRELALSFGVRDILISAYYLKGNVANIQRIVDQFDFVMLDSGAFTFQNKVSKWAEKRLGKNPSKAEANNAFRSDEFKEFYVGVVAEMEAWETKYMEVAAHFQNNPKVVVVEFDAGQPYTIYERRMRWFQAGLTPLIVWHAGTRREAFERMCRWAPYVGIGGIATGDSKYKAAMFSWVFDFAKRNGSKVHGFGMTQQEPMRRSPFFSVDSTSWLSGARFGVHYEYRGKGQMRVWDKNYKHERKRLQRRCEEIGVDWEAFRNDDAPNLNRWNLAQWAEMQTYYRESDTKRRIEYWHGADFQHTGQRDGTLRPLVHRGDLVKYEAYFLATGEWPEGYNDMGMDKDLTEEEEAKMRAAGDDPDKYPRDEFLIKKDKAEREAAAGDGELDEDAGLDDEVDPKNYDVAAAAETVRSSAGFLECNKCAVNLMCPVMKAGELCSLVPHEAPDANAFSATILQLVHIQRDRVLRISHFEKMEGGMLDGGLSAEMNQLIRLMAQYNTHRALEDARNAPAIPVGPARETDKLTVTVEAEGSPAAGGGGLLRGLLANALGGGPGQTAKGRHGSQGEAARASLEHDELTALEDSRRETEAVVIEAESEGR